MTGSGDENVLNPRAQFSIAHDYRPGMIFPLATLETGRKLVRVSFRKEFWNGYWEQGRHLRQYLNSASQITISWRETVLRTLIAGLRQDFLCVACVGLCLFVTDRVLTETE